MVISETMIQISSALLLTAFVLYVLASVLYVLTITGRKWSRKNPDEVKKVWGKRAFVITVMGFISQTGFFICRWIGQGHPPVSNMFEFMSFLAMTVVLGFIIIYAIYRIPSVGAFALPLVLALLGWSAVFDTNPQPLIPALQTYWLHIHVSTVGISQGIFAVGFATGLMYVIRTVDQTKSSKKTIALELFLLSVLMVVGFVLMTTIFSMIGYEVSYDYMNEWENEQTLTYNLPAIAGPYADDEVTRMDMNPLFSTPGWMQGVDAPRKFNTIIWSFLSGIVLYGLLRLIARKRLGAVIQPWLKDLQPPMLDEITYRAIAIAFPIFTLGGLVFAMIWAQEAWGRFWGWDPKEVWALITWLFYATYLHLRLSKGWQGVKSAWLAVIGFIIIMFNLVFVNLIIAGLHSYA